MVSFIKEYTSNGFIHKDGTEFKVGDEIIITLCNGNYETCVISSVNSSHETITVIKSHHKHETCYNLIVIKDINLTKKENDMVHHPNHYQSKNGLEVWDVIEAFTSDLSGVEAFDAGNIIKYACRWHAKNGVEDLKKVIEYANHLIKHLEEKESK